MVSMARKTGFTTGNVSRDTYSIASTIAFLPLRHVTQLLHSLLMFLVAKPLAARAQQVIHLVADFCHLNRRAICSFAIFSACAHSVFIKIFCGDKAMDCLQFANINTGGCSWPVAATIPASADADVRLKVMPVLHMALRDASRRVSLYPDASYRQPTSAAWLNELTASVEAMTAAVTMQRSAPENLSVAINGRVYDSGCKHASGGVKQRKVMD